MVLAAINATVLFLDTERFFTQWLLGRLAQSCAYCIMQCGLVTFYRQQVVATALDYG